METPNRSRWYDSPRNSRYKSLMVSWKTADPEWTHEALNTLKLCSQPLNWKGNPINMGYFRVWDTGHGSFCLLAHSKRKDNHTVLQLFLNLLNLSMSNSALKGKEEGFIGLVVEGVGALPLWRWDDSATELRWCTSFYGYKNERAENTHKPPWQ